MISLLMLVLWMRTVVTPSRAATSPWSTAKGPTAEERLPQLPPQSTSGVPTLTCAKV